MSETKKSVDKTLSKAIIAFAMALVLLVGGIVGGIAIQSHREKVAMERIDNTSVSQKVVGLKELTTAQLTYHGLVEFTDGKVRFINKKEFLMVYTAKVTAGVDFSKAEIKESGKKVTVKLPPAKIQTITIDPNSIEFYDTKKAIFNHASKEDAIDAQKEADENIRMSMDKQELLNTATVQAKQMLTDMLEAVVAEGTTIIIE